jgi:hypothetical protein
LGSSPFDLSGYLSFVNAAAAVTAVIIVDEIELGNPRSFIEQLG